MDLQGSALQNDLLKQLSSKNLSNTDAALLRCRLAKELEEAGNYEAARGALGDLWRGVGQRPHTEGLEERAEAEVLLRAGCLTGWIGGAQQIEGAQEKAKDLISEAEAIFSRLGEDVKVAEAKAELAYCYWREGAFDEARIHLKDSLSHLRNSDNDIKAITIIRRAIVELSDKKFYEALSILKDAEPFISTINSHAVRGKYHSNLAIVLNNLSLNKHGERYRDAALIEYAAASYHFEQAGHLSYCAATENNLGFLFTAAHLYKDAHLHLDRARRLYNSLGDKCNTAKVDDSRARALLYEGRSEEAEKVARSAVKTLEKGDEQAELAKSLTTYGIAIARNGKYAQAQLTLQRAAKIAEQVGDKEGAGRAQLSLIEEVGERLSRAELQNIFNLARHYLNDSQSPETVSRLLSCAEQIINSSNNTRDYQISNFIFSSEETAKLLRAAERVARTNITLLITGETGTGKEVLARLVHKWSERTGKLVAINCAAIPEGLIDSELFGHRQGSFTDGKEDRTGAVLEAVGGTLFLDEIGELSEGTQSKLLRLIENKEIHPVGADQPQLVDVRIVAATNRNLAELVKAGKFRSDLFYRLQVFEIVIPPLRRRQDDIPALAAHFIAEVCDRHGKQITFSPESIEAMRGLNLKGNARELRTLIERAVIMSSEGTAIRAEDVEVVAVRNSYEGNFADAWSGCSFKQEVLVFEAGLIKQALSESGGSITRAARLLGLSHQALHDMLEKRHSGLLDKRTPKTQRRRSIMNKEKVVKIRKVKRKGN